jgi:copper homeostasis protein
MVIEICATSVQSAINAEKAGADRIELCSELAVGGITPSYGLILKVLEKVKIPVYVLIRPRSGNFVYSDEEFETMIQDIELCKDLGCEGIVSGVLNPDFTIDTQRTQELIRASSNMNFTFHRAFDLTPNPYDSLNQLMELGVDRILTSGQATSAENGIEVLKELKEKAGDKLTILPGGGINPNNIKLFQENGFTEIHASASGILSESPAPKISMNSEKFWDETNVYVSDLEIIRQLVQNTNNH